MAVEKPTASAVGQRLLRCFICYRMNEKTATEMLGYCQSNWPRCCGEVMAYFAETDPDFPATETLPDIHLPPTDG